MKALFILSIANLCTLVSWPMQYANVRNINPITMLARNDKTFTFRIKELRFHFSESNFRPVKSFKFKGKKEGNVLFNDALNTFYLLLFVVIHMVYDHSDRERERLNPLPSLHGLLFPISSKGSFICTTPHTTVFATLGMEHWLEREIAHWVHLEGWIRRPIAQRGNSDSVGSKM